MHLRYFDFDLPADNFKIILDKGDAKNIPEASLKDSAQQLLSYFYIGLRLPNSSFWVNLRPDSPQDIIDPYLEKTDIGRIMLEADVQLKKDLASYTNPHTSEGRQYWDKLYEKAEELFGQSDISIPTITRPWIVPNEIILRDAGTNAYIYKATLKVMLESDHIPDTGYSFDDPRFKQLNDYSSELIRQLILPKLSRDVNVARRYAALRQVYYSLILAQWIKAKFKGPESPVTRHSSHVESGALFSGIDTRDLRTLESKKAWAKETYYKAYRRSFEHGEYNLQENRQSPYGITVRQYVSGGVEFQSIIDFVTVNAQHGAGFLLDLKNTAVLEAAGASLFDVESVAQDGGTVMLTDPLKISELRRIYAKIEDARQRLARPAGIVERIKNRFIKDIQPVQIGDGSFAHVYWLSEYPDLVFKVFSKDYEVQEFDAQAARMADIAGTLTYRKGSTDGFELVSVYQLAPFVYCKLTDTQGRPAGIIAQQKAEMPVEPADLDRLNREMDPELVWQDQRNTNAGYIKGRAMITDFSSLFLKKHLAREKQGRGAVPTVSRGSAAQDGGSGQKAPGIPDEVYAIVGQFDSFDDFETWLKGIFFEARMGAVLKKEVQPVIEALAILFGFESKPDSGLIESLGSIVKNMEVELRDKDLVSELFYSSANYQPVDSLPWEQDAMWETISAELHGIMGAPAEKHGAGIFSRIKQYKSLLTKLQRIIIRENKDVSSLTGPQIMEMIKGMGERIVGKESELLDDMLGFNFIIDDTRMNQKQRQAELTEVLEEIAQELRQRFPNVEIELVRKESRVPGFEAGNIFVRGLLKHAVFGNLPIKIQVRFRKALFQESAMYFIYKTSGVWQIPVWAEGIAFDTIDDFKDYQRILFGNFKRHFSDGAVTPVSLKKREMFQPESLNSFHHIGFDLEEAAQDGGTQGSEDALRAHVLRETGAEEAVDIDLTQDKERLLSQLIQAIKEKKPVIFRPDKFPWGCPSFLSILIRFREIGEGLDREFGGNADHELWRAVREVLKNAFTHGNQAEFRLPIYLYLALGMDNRIKYCDVYDHALPEARRKISMQMARGVRLWGLSKGLHDIAAGGWEYERINLAEVQGSRVRIEHYTSAGSLSAVKAVLEKEKDLEGAWIYFDVDDTLMYQIWNYPAQNFISMITAIRERALESAGQTATKENVFDEIIRRWERMEDARLAAGLLQKVSGLDEVWEYALSRGMKIGIITSRPEAMREKTLDVMRLKGMDTGRVSKSIFTGFENGKGTQVLNTLNGKSPRKIFFVDNSKAHVEAFIKQMAGEGIPPVKAFWLTEEQEAQKDKDDSLSYYWEVAESLIELPVSAAEPKRDLSLMEVALVTVLLKIAELPEEKQIAELERVRTFLSSRSFTYFLNVRGDTQDGFLGRSYLDRYLQEMGSPLKGRKDGGKIAEEIPGYDPARINDLVLTFPTFKKYYETVLYDRDWGYYGSGNVGFGWEHKDGRSIRLDFNTFPKMLSPDFGRLWADQIFRIYQSMRQAGILSPEEEFRIIEFGAGDGTLAKDMLDYFSLMSSKEQGQWQELWQQLRYTIGEHSPALRDRQKETLASLTETTKVKIRDADARMPEALLDGKKFKGVIISNELVDAFGFHRVRVGKDFTGNNKFQICLTVPVLRLGRLKELQSIDNDLAQEILKTHNAIAAALGQAAETEVPSLDRYLSYENFLKLKDLGAARQQEEVKKIIDQGLRFKEVFIDPAQFFPGQKQADTYADSDSEKLKEFAREVEQVRDYLARNKEAIEERLRRNDGPVIINVNPGIREYVREVAAILNKKDNAGYVMTVDYGGNPYSVLAAGAQEDRIITMFKGYDPKSPDDNPYTDPGRRDITAIVNARELLIDDLPLVWYAHQASLLPEESRRLKELGERYPAAFLNLIDEPRKTTNFFLMIQASAAIPEQARYQFPFYGNKWGLSRGLPLQPDQLLFLDPEKMEAMRAELEQGLREVTLGHIRKEDFPESMQANWQDYSDPQGIIFYLFQWAQQQQELTHRLFPFLTRNPEEAVAVLDFLKQQGIVRTGISSWQDKDGGKKNDAFETAFEKNDHGASEPSGSDLQSGTDLSQAGAPFSYSKDGGQERTDVAGIDFRALPINTAPAAAPAEFMLPAEQLIPAPEMENTWKEIEHMVSRGVIPPADRLKQYAATCWRNNSLARQREQLLVCVADILRLQEDQNLATEPALKDLLVLLESK